MWEDVLPGSVNWVLVIGFFPTVLSKHEKPAFVSSVITATCLSGIALAYRSLSLWLAAIPAAIQALQWAVLGYQRYRINKANNVPVWNFAEILRK